MASFIRLLTQKHNPPKPTTKPFTGMNVLVTGSNTGLGLEAAKKIASLAPNTLIITARSAEKGAATKRLIEAWLDETGSPKTTTPVDIQVLALDMSDFSNIKSFVAEVESSFSHLDVAILNAGMSRGEWKQTKQGWEETLQVNTISTTLLGLLLLPLLKKSAEASGNPTHLTFVSSGVTVTAGLGKFKKYFDTQGVLKKMNEKESFPGGFGQYQLSKVLLEYSMRHMAQLPYIHTATGPGVIVNSTCPGLCKSDLGREVREKSIFFAALLWLFFLLFGRTAEQGANIYLSAATRGVSSNGELWKDDKIFPMGPMQTSEEGKKFGDQMWKEILQTVTEIDPRVTEVVASS